MSIVKFENENSSIQTPLPSAAPARQKVFDGQLKYAAKADLPTSASSDTIIFTTDTKEFFLGKGLRGGLEPFSSIEMYSSIAEFPAGGVESRIYLDQGSSSIYFYAEGRYRQIGTGDGVRPEGLRDVRIGDLNLLATSEKSSVVAALNEVFRKIDGFDATSFSDKIDAVRSEALDATARINVTTSNLVLDMTNLRNRTSDLDIKTQEAIANIGILSGSVNSATKRISDIELETANAKRVAEDTQREFSLLRETVNSLDLNRLDNLDVLAAKVGDLTTLSTEQKGSLVSALNELRTAVAALEAPSEENLLAPIEARLNDAELNVVDLQARIADLLAFDSRIPAPEDIVTRSELRQEISNISLPSLSGLATEQYVDNKISDIKPQAVDLTNYVQRGELATIEGNIENLSSAIDNIAVGGNVDLTGYAKTTDVYTKTEVDNAIAGVEVSAPVSIDHLATKAELQAAINSAKPDLTGLATEAFVAQKVSSIVIPDTSGFAKKTDIDTAIANIVFPTAPDLSSFVTKQTYNAAIADLLAFNNRIPSPEIIVTRSELQQEIGKIDASSLAKKADVYTKAEINELSSSLATKAEVQVLQSIDLSTYAKTTEVAAVDTKVTALQTKVNSMITITQAEKTKYDAYESTLNNLLNTVIPSLLGRIEVLEGYHAGGTNPVDPAEPEEPTTPESDVLWQYDFVVGPGAIDYKLGKDEPGGVFPYTLGSTEEVYGEGKLFLYWIGYTTSAEKEPVLVESIGIDPEGMSPEVPHKSYYYDNYNLFFSTADLNNTRYRLVMKR